MLLFLSRLLHQIKRNIINYPFYLFYSSSYHDNYSQESNPFAYKTPATLRQNRRCSFPWQLQHQAMQNRQESQNSQSLGRSRCASLDSESSDSQSRAQVLPTGGEGAAHGFNPHHGTSNMKSLLCPYPSITPKHKIFTRRREVTRVLQRRARRQE